MSEWITKKPKWITKKENKPEWITKKEKKQNWITKKEEEPPKMGNPAVVETYEDARENAMINRNIPAMKYGSKKPVKAVFGVLALGALGAKALSKATKKSAVAEPNNEQYAMNNQNKIVDLYQKATGTAKMKTGGDVVVGKGGDYIKDLID